MKFMEQIVVNNKKALYFLSILLLFSQIIVAQTYSLSLKNISQTQKIARQGTRCNIPGEYQNISACYLPSATECKKLTPEQIENRLKREYGADLQRYQGQILQLYSHYKSINFISMVKQFPQYTAFVCATARKIRKKFLFKMRMKWHGVHDIFLQLEQEVIVQQERERKAAPSKRVVMKQRDALRERQKEYTLHPCTSRLLQQKQQERLRALNSYFAGNDRCTEQVYTLTTQARQLILRSEIAPLSQTLVCLGNELQQQVYKECVESINALAQSNNARKISNLDTFILELSALGLNAASSGLVTQTYSIMDFCWSAIDHFQAAGEGVYDGVINVAHMIAHPIDTAVGTVRGLSEVRFFLGKLLYEVGDIVVTAAYDVEHAHEKSD